MTKDVKFSITIEIEKGQRTRAEVCVSIFHSQGKIETQT